MSTHASGSSGNSANASTTLGVGGPTSGQDGATPTHETQRETGGSGTAPAPAQGDATQAPAAAPPDTAAVPAGPTAAVDAEGSAMQSGARGAQDTRARQAGGTGTGLGTPETGANQSPDDLAPPR